jgi:Calcineurin-like phosphoesterase
MAILFAIFADIHYADKDDEHVSYDTTRCRQFRSSLSRLRNAAHYSASHGQTPSFAINLGDAVDGSEYAVSALVEKKTCPSLNSVFNHFESQQYPTFSTIGNHELYWVPRDKFRVKQLAMLERFKHCASIDGQQMAVLEKVVRQLQTSTYYSFVPIEGTKLIVLDCFDVNDIRTGCETEDKRRGVESAGIEFSCRIKWNGGIGNTQLIWLEKELKESAHLGQSVICFGHVGIEDSVARADSLLWNHADVKRLFSMYGCVRAYIYGHEHVDAYGHVDDCHHICLRAVCETPHELDAYYICIVDTEGLVLRSASNKINRECKFF